MYKGKAKDFPKQTKGNKSSDCRRGTDSVPHGRFFAEDILKTSSSTQFCI